MANDKIKVKASFDDRQVSQALQAAVDRNPPKVKAKVESDATYKQSQYSRKQSELSPEAYYQETLWGKISGIFNVVSVKRPPFDKRYLRSQGE